MNLMKAEKDRLRQEMLNRRQLLSPEQVAKISSKIISRLDRLPPLKKAGTIMAYASIKNEVDLEPWLEQLVLEGKTVLLPRVEGSKLLAVPWQDWISCQLGPYKIREPQGNPIEPGEIDAVLVPGLAFDGRGYRLGYGKGYYDRFLSQLSPHSFLCGAAYEFQVVESIFPDENDVPLHWIVTEQSEVAVDMRFY
jgi:5-formyltetrahydrofolate cyclo-ligase